MTREEMVNELEKRGISVPSTWKVAQVRELYKEVTTAPEPEDDTGPFGVGGNSPRG